MIGLLAVTAPTALAADPAHGRLRGPAQRGAGGPGRGRCGSGRGDGRRLPDNSTIWYVVTYSGLSGPLAAAHIHTGAAGANGGVILPARGLREPHGRHADGGRLQGQRLDHHVRVRPVARDQDQRDLRQPSHAQPTPVGEIRGQVLAKGNAHFASLDGAQEVPSVTTFGAGGPPGWSISSNGSSITYFLAYSGLSGPSPPPHIHLGAVGAKGGVMLPFAASASPMTGTLTAADLRDAGHRSPTSREPSHRSSLAART